MQNTVFCAYSDYAFAGTISNRTDYLLFDNLKMINKWWTLILSGSFRPMGTVLLTQAFKSVPDELIEAARLDGAGTLGILFQLMLPVAPQAKDSGKFCWLK